MNQGHPLLWKLFNVLIADRSCALAWCFTTGCANSALGGAAVLPLCCFGSSFGDPELRITPLQVGVRWLDGAEWTSMVEAMDGTKWIGTGTKKGPRGGPCAQEV